MDFTHANASRISTETRKVLHYPAEQVHLGLQHKVKELGEQREQRVRVRKESEVARKYFGNLVRETGEGKVRVEDVDLEGVQVPGVAGGYDEGVMV